MKKNFTHKIKSSELLEFRWTLPGGILKDGTFSFPTFSHKSYIIHVDENYMMHFKISGNPDVEYAIMNTARADRLIKILDIPHDMNRKSQEYGLVFPHPQFPCLTTINCTRMFEREGKSLQWKVQDNRDVLVGAFMSLAG